MKISRETLHQLIENKLCQAGLKREHAATVAEVLVYADARGIHSHGAVRVEYYAERISKGGTNREPEFRLEETGPCSAILHADNAAGQVAAKWVWNMPSKPPSKMALRWSVSAGWVTAAQSLILCSRQPAPDSLAFRCASPIQWWCRLAARKFTTVLTPGLCRAGRRRRDPYL